MTDEVVALFVRPLALAPGDLVEIGVAQGYPFFLGKRENLFRGLACLCPVFHLLAQLVEFHVVLLTFANIVKYSLGRGVAAHGLGANFTYYTQCSNLLGAIACAACLVAEVRELLTGRAPGHMARVLKYWASCCLLMTFVVVVAVLAPMLESAGRPGFYLMFVEGAKPITHFGAPVLVICSYAVFEAVRPMTLRQSIIGVVPTLAYALVAYPCNIARLWDGPYPFLQVWNMPVWASFAWFAVLLVLSFALCQVPRLAGNAFGKSK